MSGKRTQRTHMPKQLGFDFELKKNIVMISELNRRSIELQLLHWIEAGVEADMRKMRHGNSHELTQPHKAADENTGQRRSA